MIDDRRFFTWMDHGGSVNAPAEDNERQKQRATFLVIEELMFDERGDRLGVAKTVLKEDVAFYDLTTTLDILEELFKLDDGFDDDGGGILRAQKVVEKNHGHYLRTYQMELDD
jgi:hypothetical protein